jgi:hypothetical protein
MATKNQLKTRYLILYYSDQDHIDYIPAHLGLFYVGFKAGVKYYKLTYYMPGYQSRKIDGLWVMSRQVIDLLGCW